MKRSSSHDSLARIGAAARKAAHAGNWETVRNCAQEILKQDKQNPEGWFLSGLLENNAGRSQQAAAAFTKAIQLDPTRFEAAIELANLCLVFLRHREALALLNAYLPSLANNPHYLDMAANIYSRLGLPAKAWPLYLKADELQPAIDHFQADLAACAAQVGKTAEASTLYHDLLARHPGDQKSHYQLSQLEKVQDASHLEWMKDILDSTRLAAEKNIYLYCAIAKEHKDLEQWPESFQYYKLAGEAALSASTAAVDEGCNEIEVIDRITERCGAAWLTTDAKKKLSKYRSKSPVFIVGFPGTDTRLIENIVARHSKVESAGETHLMHAVIQRACAGGSEDKMTPALIEAASKKDIDIISTAYRDAVDYKLHGHPMFIDRMPENFLYLGFIVKAFPDAQIIHLKKNPMDACFSMYERSFFKTAIAMEELGSHYAAYQRLAGHWREVLGDRVIEIDHESMVADRESQTRHMLERLGLEVEPACLEIQGESITEASAGQWKNWERELQPLKDRLENLGISTDGH